LQKKAPYALKSLDAELKSAPAFRHDRNRPGREAPGARRPGGRPRQTRERPDKAGRTVDICVAPRGPITRL
jgi:hypothetical protein